MALACARPRPLGPRHLENSRTEPRVRPLRVCGYVLFARSDPRFPFGQWERPLKRTCWRQSGWL